ncbi:hypothetical protein GCM10010404_88290 [Nonomuraea africana]
MKAFDQVARRRRLAIDALSGKPFGEEASPAAGACAAATEPAPYTARAPTGILLRPKRSPGGPVSSSQQEGRDEPLQIRG